MLSGLGLAGCGVVSAVKKIANNVASNRATIDDFTSKLQSGEATAFEAKYMTTGSAPATIVYAVQPPKGLAFKDTAQGILGYVKVAGDSTSFQIRSYTTSPSPALFRLPPGAKVTNVKNGKG